MHRTQSDLKSWLWVSLLFLLLVNAPAPADADDDVRPSDMQTGMLMLRMATGYKTATLLNTDVEMKISGLVARVAVRQSFRNTSDDWVEGVYVFPLPDKAAVDRMRLHIGDRFIEGEIQEKEKAKKRMKKQKPKGARPAWLSSSEPISLRPLWQTSRPVKRWSSKSNTWKTFVTRMASSVSDFR